MTNIFKPPPMPAIPEPKPPPPLPDINSPANLAAQRLATARAGQSGRTSTQLTSAAGAAGTLAGSAMGGAYSGTKAGG
ncbi:MAG TPA: hypothetical protein VNG04_00415 [Candidatus Acidoferrum sp.]|nr:hypothetical protein [Candidatus Acidoferrum sp.]